MSEAGGGRSFFGKVRRRFLGWGRKLRKAARWMLGGGLGLLLPLTLLFPDGSPFPLPIALGVLFAMLLIGGALPVWLLGLLANLGWARKAELRVEASDAREEAGALLVTRGDKTKRYEASDIASGMVLPRKDGAELRLRLVGDHELSIRFEGEAAAKDADALCDALGLSAHQRRTDHRWTPVAHAIFGAIGSTFAVFMALGAMINLVKETPFEIATAFLFLTLPFIVGGAVVRSIGREVEIGRDGVFIKNGLRRDRFDFRSVKTAELFHEPGNEHNPERRGLRLRMREGDPLEFELAGSPAQLSAVLDRLNDALAHYRRAASSHDAPFCREAGAALGDWADGLIEQVRREGSFRQATLRKADAIAVVEDPRAHPEARVGAALALAELGTDAEQLRVRVAAEGTVYPKVRVVLERALDGELDEEALAEAVEEVGVEEVFEVPAEAEV